MQACPRTLCDVGSRKKKKTQNKTKNNNPKHNVKLKYKNNKIKTSLHLPYSKHYSNMYNIHIQHTYASISNICEFCYVNLKCCRYQLVSEKRMLKKILWFCNYNLKTVVQINYTLSKINQGYMKLYAYVYVHECMQIHELFL